MQHVLCLFIINFQFPFCLISLAPSLWALTFFPPGHETIADCILMLTAVRCCHEPPSWLLSIRKDLFKTSLVVQA